jgi:hypothetical protein
MIIFIVTAILLLAIFIYMNAKKNPVDNYTSAQPNPPHNVVYPYNSNYRYPVLGLDCTGPDCQDCVYPNCRYNDIYTGPGYYNWGYGGYGGYRSGYRSGYGGHGAGHGGGHGAGHR